MTDDDLTPYFEALHSEESYDRLVQLIIDAKKAGGTQEESYQLMTRFREVVGCNIKDQSKEEERLDDIICDAMDLIVGWSRWHIFSDRFDETSFWISRENDSDRAK